MFPPQVGTAQSQRPSQTSLQGARLGWDMKARHGQDPDLRWKHGRKVLRWRNSGWNPSPVYPFEVCWWPPIPTRQQPKTHQQTSLRIHGTTRNPWWKTPPESPALNPIELVWHELKHFLRTIVTPTTKEDLLAGITRFWRERMTAEECEVYINHLKKVIPKVIERESCASGH